MNSKCLTLSLDVEFNEFEIPADELPGLIQAHLKHIIGDHWRVEEGYDDDPPTYLYRFTRVEVTSCSST
jgi:hypothetical protein